LVSILGGEVTYVPRRPGEPDCTFANIQKIVSLLGWKPRVTFEDGVKGMLADIEQWEDAPLWDPESIARATETWFRYLGNNRS
jgi:UDP-glucose 4-epimerase